MSSRFLTGAFSTPFFALLALALSSSVQAQSGPLVTECAACHGMDGIARDAEVPHLAGQNQAYLVNQLRAFKQGRRPHKEMLTMSRHMTDEDMQTLAAYYSSLPSR